MNWNYDELAEMLSMGRIDVDRAAFPYMLDEARKRRDGDVIADIASNYYEDVDDSRYIELVSEAAELGSEKANFWMGWMYQSGKKLPRDYEKAYQHFLKSEEYDWVPIDPEENAEFEIDGEVEVTSEDLLLYCDIGWWLFVLEKHPSRALKCWLADWYMKQGGDENRKMALKLLEGSAKEGFVFARHKLAAL